MGGRVPDEGYLKDEVGAIIDKGDLGALDRPVDKYGRERVSSVVNEALQKAGEQVKSGLVTSYMLCKKGLFPEKFCEKTLREAYDQLDEKSLLIPSLNSLSEEQGASYYKSLFLKFLERDKIRFK